MPNCIGIKKDGSKCIYAATTEDRCKTHHRMVVEKGPNKTAREELANIHRMEMRKLNEHYANIIDQDAIQNGIDAVKALRKRQLFIKNMLIRDQKDEIRRTGIDPDAEAIARKERANRELQDRIEAMRQARAAQIQIMQERIEAMRNNVDRAMEVAVGQQPVAFTQDPQNVHRSATVTQTIDIINKVLDIPVPDEYRWNVENCSKTIGEIILECNLTPRAAWQMAAKYCQDESIYELGSGIYGRVLDCVWQYVKKSDDKQQLCAIIKQEMEDNIGMCAQGNLSRLCNVLAGYMDNVGLQESVSEIMGRLLPPLMELEDIADRIDAAMKIFKDNKVDKNEWMIWLAPLIEGEESRVVTVIVGHEVHVNVDDEL